MNCLGITLQGRPCQRSQEPGHNEWCAFHDPDGQFTARREWKLERHVARKIAAAQERERKLAELGEAINARHWKPK